MLCSFIALPDIQNSGNTLSVTMLLALACFVVLLISSNCEMHPAPHTPGSIWCYLNCCQNVLLNDSALPVSWQMWRKVFWEKAGELFLFKSIWGLFITINSSSIWILLPDLLLFQVRIEHTKPKLVRENRCVRKKWQQQQNTLSSCMDYSVLWLVFEC